MISRRRFLQSSASLALLPLLPRVVRSADTVVRTRPSWDTFCTGPLYEPFVAAIGAMRANRGTTTPANWGYWVDVHQSSCPHRSPYFLAWHRGFLYRFEENLRTVSGNPDMVLPYWDYYTHPQIPPEFLDTTSPLWRKERTGEDVTEALSLDPFADDVINFQRGSGNAFEPKLENAPHNPVHNLIGGAMGDVAISPRDPLFWVHHANIDRLWLAWFEAGDGRHMPRAYQNYWQGSFQYGDAVEEVPRVWARNPSRYMFYQYENETMPAALPPTDPPPSTSTATARAATLSTFSLRGTAPLRPASVGTTALGTSQSLVLDEHSVTVDVALTAQNASQVRSMLLRPQAAQATAKPDPLRLVLDGVQLTGLGAKGGYFYKIYVNLPEQPGVNQPERTYLLGMLGSFEIGVAQMQAAMQGKGMQGMHDMRAAGGKPDVRFVFPMSEALRGIWPTDLDTLSISFVRANGRAHPAKGHTIRVKTLRVEADD
ncbi:tyrosinase family protein [Frateuria sp. MAH-13]|uniref:Tyrosinase family protein n=1 Tax=Frateuria flava TaxID=2821489 RepID=A0ABS4DL98_9GAMM|nr:tyrosinase family protein [Frateuria flava]MBP1473818.1 tyrosinase family protein [Frateuria flava]